MNETTDDRGQKLLTYRVEQLEEAVGEIRDAVKSIDSSLKVFAVIELKQANFRDGLKATNSTLAAIITQIREIELDLPTLRLVRNWVIAGVIGVVGTVGTAVVALVLRP